MLWPILFPVREGVVHGWRVAIDSGDGDVVLGVGVVLLLEVGEMDSGWNGRAVVVLSPLLSADVFHVFLEFSVQLEVVDVSSGFDWFGGFTGDSVWGCRCLGVGLGFGQGCSRCADGCSGVVVGRLGYSVVRYVDVVDVESGVVSSG